LNLASTSSAPARERGCSQPKWLTRRVTCGISVQPEVVTPLRAEHLPPQRQTGVL